MGLILYLIRILSPVVARLAVFIFRMMVYALVVVLIGFPRAVDFIAQHWVDEAVRNKWVPTRWERLAYWVFCVVASIQFIVGFVALSHVVVLLTAWLI